MLLRKVQYDSPLLLLVGKDIVHTKASVNTAYKVLKAAIESDGPRIASEEKVVTFLVLSKKWNYSTDVRYDRMMTAMPFFAMSERSETDASE